MALSTYSDLVSAVGDWLERADLDARIPDFIRLCESKLNRALGIRSLESDVAMTGVPGSRYIALPAGFRNPINFWIKYQTGQRRPLRFTEPGLVEVDTTASEPRSWCVDGSNIAFERPCDQAYDFVMRSVGGLALSEASPTNLVLDLYPDLYLYGCQVEAGIYLRDNELITVCKSMFEQALNEARWKEARNKSLATLTTEPGVLLLRRRRSGYSVFSDQ